MLFNGTWVIAGTKVKEFHHEQENATKELTYDLRA
jgi:hypothetical protein